MNSPEDIIQAAWVARAKRDIAAKRAAGLQAREITFPAWAPEEAVQALLHEGWRPPACGCGPQATSEPQRSDNRDAERAICGAPKPLSKAEWAALDELEGDLKNLSEAERLAQGFDETEGAE